MIHEIGQDLLTQLKQRGVPFSVIDARSPEDRATSTFDRERIVIGEDRDAEDTFEATKKTGTNPIVRYRRLTGAKLTIYAKHHAPGATYWEHRRRCDLVLDSVLNCLYVVAKNRQNILALKSGKYVDPPDLKESDTPGGIAYELRFVFDRGVPDVTWQGAAQPQTVVSPQMIGAPSITFAGSTITRSVGSFLLDGFAVGQSVIVTGSAHNNGTLGPITVLTDTVMTFAAALTSEGPVSGVSITGNGVVINSTATANGESVGVTINA